MKTMTVYELIQELVQYDADDLVQFRIRADGMIKCDSCSEGNGFIVDQIVENWTKMFKKIQASNDTVTIELESIGGLDGNY